MTVTVIQLHSASRRDSSPRWTPTHSDYLLTTVFTSYHDSQDDLRLIFTVFLTISSTVLWTVCNDNAVRLVVNCNQLRVPSTPMRTYVGCTKRTTHANTSSSCICSRARPRAKASNVGTCSDQDVRWRENMPLECSSIGPVCSLDKGLACVYLTVISIVRSCSTSELEVE